MPKHALNRHVVVQDCRGGYLVGPTLGPRVLVHKRSELKTELEERRCLADIDEHNLLVTDETKHQVVQKVLQ